MGLPLYYAKVTKTCFRQISHIDSRSDLSLVQPFKEVHEVDGVSCLILVPVNSIGAMNGPPQEKMWLYIFLEYKNSKLGRDRETVL
jgi:hypothetical protein